MKLELSGYEIGDIITIRCAARSKDYVVVGVEKSYLHLRELTFTRKFWNVIVASVNWKRILGWALVFSPFLALLAAGLYFAGSVLLYSIAAGFLVVAVMLLGLYLVYHS